MNPLTFERSFQDFVYFCLRKRKRSKILNVKFIVTFGNLAKTLKYASVKLLKIVSNLY